MSFKRSLCLGGSIIASALAISSAAYAQDEAEVGEVYVTATRRAENVQDVPMNVTPISGEKLQDFNIFKFEDVQALTPGLSIGFDAEDSPVIQIRGVSFSTFSSSAPAVDVYVNEVFLDGNQAFQTVFDIGQIEVLRGPQGTLRGRPAPVGAITVTTRRPDMDEFGVYGSASASDLGGRNLEAGVNIPLIEDVLAVRFAGAFEERGGGITNALTGDESRRKTGAWRGTVKWLPTDNLELILTQQHLDTDSYRYLQLEGDGPNGPPIRAEDRMGVAEFPQTGEQAGHDLTWLNVNWDVAGHRLSYIGAYHELTNGAPGGVEEEDPGNGDPGSAPVLAFVSSFKHINQELRFETTGPDRLLDYTVGLYYDDNDTVTELPADGFNLPIRTVEKAGYGNATLHLGRTDVSLGARYSEVTRTDTNLGCLFVGGFFPAFCAPGQSPANPQQEVTSKGWVYNANVTHHVTDDLMVYGTYGRSRRPGVPSVAVFPLDPTNGFQFNCSELACGAPVEISDSYEIGMKSTWREGKVRFNAAVFHQDYENYIGRSIDVPYLNLLDLFAGNPVNAGGGFNARGPAVVDGVEADLFVRVSDNLDLQMTWQTADGHFEDAFIPCRDGNFDGVPDDIVNQNPAAYPAEGLAGCNVSTAISQVPNWSLTMSGEYRHDIWGYEGYVRTLLNYEPENANVRPGTSFVRDSRTLVNLFVGLRNRGSWDVNVWAKNLFDEETLLDRDPANIFSPNGVDTGYRRVSTETPREIGVTVRRSFGAG